MKATKTYIEIVTELRQKAKPNGSCLECHLAPSVDRQGRKRHYVMVGGRTGQRLRVTRLVYEVVKGPITNGQWVLHTCDNPACINPDHLFLGTAQDNTSDMIAKGRKIDDPTVGPRRRAATAKFITPLLAQGLSCHEIGCRLGLSASTVWNYVNGPYKSSLPVSSRD